ncbi:MAG TPA: MFS transporter [Bacteroidetes bacterium]|nr:MFS transporter [Bacteroidota bacterium]
MKSSYNLKYITAISLVSALGGLLFGYDWVVIGGAKPFYEQFFSIADMPYLQGWAISSALVGCVGGTFLSGFLSDKYGRKNLLILASVFFTVSAAGTGASCSFTIFILYRILGGLGIGLASNLSPVYIAEVTPANIRGKFVSINQLTIVLGILLAQIVNWQIAKPVPENATADFILHSWNGQTGWRWMFWAEMVPASIFFLLMWLVPESPRFLVRKRKYERSFSILEKIGGKDYAGERIRDIKDSLRQNTGRLNLKVLWSPGITGIVVIGVVLAVFQQWCGINVIFMYAEEIFTAAGYSVSDMLFNIVITGSVNLVFTFVAMALVDKVGRKTLMLIGAGSLAVIYTIMGFFYYIGVQGFPLLILVVMAIAAYAMTLAPVTWVILSEIFPNKVRGAAMAVSTFALWTANALLAYSFPVINKSIQASGSFWLFAGISVFGFFFIRAKLTETKGKTLEQIEKELIGKPVTEE